MSVHQGLPKDLHFSPTPSHNLSCAHIWLKDKHLILGEIHLNHTKAVCRLSTWQHFLQTCKVDASHVPPSKERSVCLHGSEELDPWVPPLDATGLAKDKMTFNCLQKRGRKIESYNLLVTEVEEIIPFKRVFLSLTWFFPSFTLF